MKTTTYTCDTCGKTISEDDLQTVSVSVSSLETYSKDACSYSCVRRILIQFINKEVQSPS